MRPRRKLAADLLVGRHGLHGRVVLVGADEVCAVGAGGAQHRVDVLEDPKRLLLALGRAGMRRILRKHIGRDAALEVLRHHAGGEHPAAGLHALRELDLARAELDGQQRLRCGCGVFIGHRALVI